MSYDISERVQKWSLEAISPAVDFNDIHAAIEDLIAKRFNQYVPTATGPHPDFRTRLANWLSQVSDDDQKVLFQLVPHIFFLGREEFLSLCHAAFRTSVVKWLIEQANLQFSDRDFEARLNELLHTTWFCSITDWDLGTFYRVNRISGTGIRPDLTSLSKLSNAREVLRFLRQHGLQRIVVVEDFVGSGLQMQEVEPILTSLAAANPLLLVPLIVCPAGYTAGTSMANAHANITFDPVLRPPLDSFVNERPNSHEPVLFGDVRSLVKRLYSVVSGGLPPDDSTSPYGPFGFARTGGLLVLYTNCPDNSLPAIHYQSASSSWRALFPRASRLAV